MLVVVDPDVRSDASASASASDTCTERVKRLKSDLLSVRREICVERAALVTESYRETEGLPFVLRRALALQNVLRRMTVRIYDGELIVGNQASDRRFGPMFPDMDWQWISDELDTFQTRAESFDISEEKKAVLRETFGYWKGRAIHDRIEAHMPEQLKAALGTGVFDVCLHLSKGTGHFLMNYGKVLTQGLGTILKDVRATLDGLDMARDPHDVDRHNFLNAVVVACEAAIAFAHRLADEADRLAAIEADASRRRELGLISSICRRIPEQPATTFREAVQCFWLLQLIPHIDNDGTAISPGRFDRYMYPYLRRDLDDGRITIGEAQELVDCLWVKFNEVLQVWKEQDTKYFGGFPISQNLTVGGVTETGEDATNVVSYLCLEATRRLKLPQPALSVRLHSGSPRDFVLKTCEVIRAGVGMPAVFDDEVVIPAMMNRGIGASDARDYAIIGCVEPGVPAKSCTWSNAAYFNLAKCLELALNDGVCRLTGRRVGPETGDPRSFKAFEDVLGAFHVQVRALIRETVAVFNVIEAVHRRYNPLPFMSALIDACTERGADVLDGGALHNFAGVQGVGIANVANSLAAVKKLVFEDRVVSVGQVVDALEADFAGHEELRSRLHAGAPKYGNDDPHVDSLARAVGRFYCEELAQYRNGRGGSYQPGLYPVSANVPLGASVGATPEGRKARTPLADGVSPTHGTDVKGPTAVIRSVAALDHMLASNGTLLNLKLSPDLLASREGLERLASLLQALVDLRVLHVQFNVVSGETLRAAQRDPRSYDNLVVRVAGYSAFFNELSREIQDDIIGRTEHCAL